MKTLTSPKPYMAHPINKNPLSVFLRSCLVSAFLLLAGTVMAQMPRSVAPDSALVRLKAPVPENKVKPWYERIALRGYVQFRYNRLLETNPDLKSEHDKSIGRDGGFLIRRARLVFSGNVHDRVYIYIQPDLASMPSSSGSVLHFAQVRDAYFDLSLDHKKEYRFRVGQSKVPYGFENMQSSQNRLTLDRNDALNSAVPNERDLGVFFYWAPEHIRQRFNELANSTYKGSGDYGVLGIGVYNGQSANKKEANDNQHIAARLAYPFAIKNQIIEPGIQGYTGLYNVGTDQLSTVSINGDKLAGNYRERRMAGSLVLYPKPFGLQVEYNVGESPVFDPETKKIKVGRLHGGYALAMYHLKVGQNNLIPFAKVQYHKGGKKTELDARYGETYETELGLEWQPITNFELVAQYTISDRLTQDGRNLYNRQHGNLLRLQAQFNF